MGTQRSPYFLPFSFPSALTGLVGTSPLQPPAEPHPIHISPRIQSTLRQSVGQEGKELSQVFLTRLSLCASPIFRGTSRKGKRDRVGRGRVCIGSACTESVCTNTACEESVCGLFAQRAQCVCSVHSGTVLHTDTPDPLMAKVLPLSMGPGCRPQPCCLHTALSQAPGEAAPLRSHSRGRDVHRGTGADTNTRASQTRPSCEAFLCGTDTHVASRVGRGGYKGTTGAWPTPPVQQQRVALAAFDVLPGTAARCIQCHCCREPRGPQHCRVLLLQPGVPSPALQPLSAPPSAHCPFLTTYNHTLTE